MKEKVAIYWARRDLRILDNPALFAAVTYSKKEKVPLLPLFILEDYMVEGHEDEQFGYPSRYFLTKAIPLYAKHFKRFSLIRGKAAKSIIELSHHFDITVFVNEDVYVDFYTQLNKIRASGVSIKLYEDMMTVSKETKTGTGNLYSVFTPFKNSVWEEFCTKKVLPKPNLESVEYFNGTIDSYVHSIPEIDETSLQKIVSVKRGFRVGGVTYHIDSLISEAATYDAWYFDEVSAIKMFDVFLKHGIAAYKERRDSLDYEGTSRMSLALAWGLVSSRTLREKIQKHYGDTFVHASTSSSYEGAVHYISELIWREFYKYLFYHHPELMNTEFQEKFRGTIAWVDEKVAHERFIKWIQGETGYPIVDAAMMELAKTGYMHNRARMIVASVLTKNLGVDWRWGQEYFRATLLDLDEASNNGGWQWGASVGADPKPIRIFNPYLQAENYDKEKKYQTKYLRNDYFKNPPNRIIEHKDAREDALMRYGLKGSNHGEPRDY